MSQIRSNWQNRAAVAGRCAGLLSLALSAALVACGGGGGEVAVTPPVVTPATASAQGPILGFGSIIVGSVRWDESNASITDDDGVAQGRSALKLGMVVAVDGNALNKLTATGTATHVQFGSETVGPVASVNVAASSFVVLGQTIKVTATTVFDASITGALAGLATGAVVEVHGLPDTTTHSMVATRIELKTNANSYKLRGVVASVDTVAKTFRIGSELISYANFPQANFVNGDVVRVRLQTTKVAGAWVLTDMRGGAPRPVDRRDAELEGVITAWTSAKSFDIGGVHVDANAAAFPDGTTGVVLGARVEVEGAIAAGVLTATKVELADSRGGGAARMFELHGAMSALDTTAHTFVLRGVTVNYGGSVTFKGGAVADLANGKNVEVKGTLSADRSKLDAKTISFES